MLQLVVAEKLGMTVTELQQRMTLEELLLWSAFYEHRSDLEKKALKDARKGRR